MRFPIQSHLVSWLVFILWLTAFSAAPADVLIGQNGERFVGKIIEENADEVVFESATGGRLTVSRGRILELQRSPVPQTIQTNPLPSTSSLTISNMAWAPPAIGKDGFDWIELKSGEWLKGYLKYVRDKKVQFESVELEDLTLGLKDVRQFHSGRSMFTRFDGRRQIYGTVTVSNEVVQVIGPEQVALPRGQLQGITPGGEREIEFWSGKALFGLNVQAGNSKQTTLNASAELERHTPATQFLLDYLGNVGEADGNQTANNHRINLSHDVRLNRDWFFRPIQLEYYRDPLANTAHRVTGGFGVGYYLFDRDGLEWKVAADPGYQYARFESVEAGEPDARSTPAGLLQSRFKADITRRLTFIETYSGTVTSESAGLYTHHLVSSLEFEIKRHLDLELSFVWDYLQRPQVEEHGVVPKQSDLRLTFSVGAKF